MSLVGAKPCRRVSLREEIPPRGAFDLARSHARDNRGFSACIKTIVLSHSGPSETVRAGRDPFETYAYHLSEFVSGTPRETPLLVASIITGP